MTRRLLAARPWLQVPHEGLLELQLSLACFIVRAFRRDIVNHPGLAHLPSFLSQVRDRVRRPGQELGFVPQVRATLLPRLGYRAVGTAFYVRSLLARSSSVLVERYLQDLGFEGPVTAQLG